MVMILEGRSAIVTGGAGGLGSATVRRLVDARMKVVIFDLNADGAEVLAKEVGGATVPVGGDGSDDEAAEAAVAAAQSLGVLSVLVNVAGGATGGGRIVGRDRSPLDKGIFLETLQMNVVATFNMSRFGAAAMGSNEPDEDGQRGVIVNTGSIAGLEGQAGQIAYGSAKAAILGMTLPMARDLAVMGIRVMGIAPGTMGTPLMLSGSDEMRAKLTANIQFPKRMGKPGEFAELVEAILRNPYLNGENIRLDGALRFPPK
jgi:NAD(P)-dependent dehydrogenase (short-subunit alcohol dehydrogenase family)